VQKRSNCPENVKSQGRKKRPLIYAYESIINMDTQLPDSWIEQTWLHLKGLLEAVKLVLIGYPEQYPKYNYLWNKKTKGLKTRGKMINERVRICTRKKISKWCKTFKPPLSHHETTINAGSATYQRFSN
jgi:hypothetical protein